MNREVRLVSSRRVDPLTEAEWELSSVEPGSATHPSDLDRAAVAWRKASCPGTVAEVLRDAGQDLAGLGRIDALDWWYRARFAVGGEDAGRPMVLVCGGLATLAELWLNGSPIGRADSMHRGWRFPVKLRQGDNELLIRFASVEAFVTSRHPRPRWRVPMLVHQNLRMVRTTLLGRTPGWSPPVPPVGPWRPIALMDADAPRLENLRVRTRLDGDRGEVLLTARIAGEGWPDLLDARFEVARGDAVRHAPILRQERLVQASVEVPAPDLWWPHTHGEPALYDTSLRFGTAGDGSEGVQTLGRIGFRSLAVDQAGGGFRLLVNGVPVFCRGACWTPLDPVTCRAGPEDIRTALRQAAEAGMNMIRVCGTTIYEDDAFYRAASVEGMLVWQDFMFANMDFPADNAGFQENVEAEVHEFLGRVGDEPCLAVLCGNSEVEQQAAMWGAGRQHWQPALFHETIPALCRADCPDIPYWPSSAHGGAFPHEAASGTSSYYGVGAYLRPLDDARRSGLAFATEALAFANVPEPANLRSLVGEEPLRVHSPAWKARVPRDLGAGWDFDDTRDHYLERLYGVDPAGLRRVDHERYLALSRAVTADVMEASFAEWRRAGSPCGGALVWFLRDLWPGAGCGVVDSDGLPKAPWWALRRVLAPRTIFFTDEGVNGLLLHAVNERAELLAGRVLLVLYGPSANVGRQIEIPVELAPRSRSAIRVAEHLDEFVDLTYSYRFGPPPVEVIAAELVGADGETVATAFHCPAGPLVDPRDVGLDVVGRESADGALELDIATTGFARFVRIDVDGMLPADNYFHLAPGRSRRIRLSRTRPGVRLGGTVGALNAINERRIKWSTP
jgi:beta-mannosidase